MSLVEKGMSLQEPVPGSSEDDAQLGYPPPSEPSRDMWAPAFDPRDQPHPEDHYARADGSLCQLRYPLSKRREERQGASTPLPDQGKQPLGSADHARERPSPHERERA